MKKSLAFILCLLLIGVIVFAIIISTNKKSDSIESTPIVESKTEEKTQESEKAESTEPEESKEGYEILLSKKEITVEEGATESFEITFTNPDETSIREYIHCDDQADLVEVRYTPLENKKITVEVEGLKPGTTEISISDYEYPEVKTSVKVSVIEK